MKKQTKKIPFQPKKTITALFDKKISGKNKLMAVVIVLYIISPIDLIPDFIPLAGYADDVMLPILLIIMDKLLSEKKELEVTHTIKEAK